ncbi:AAA family ATPase [Bradyrhizobium japonicum]|uniref:AAA family ATPase n=1 Tax=Bradyrhizobium japonicum TaxID=375 RepID=UPI002715281B|nr:AAA family ATPase [Bradyrhizobium japonicum]WLB53903.1 AAA family ATPase [Bradyrhizobium japonicum]
MQIKVPIHQLLWEEIQAEPNNHELVDAILTIAVSRTDLGSGKFITAQCLKDGSAGFSAENVQSIVFARSIILFGALLPPSEMVELLAMAAELGCKHLDATKPPLTALTTSSGPCDQVHKAIEIVEPPRLEVITGAAVAIAPPVEHAPSPKIRKLVEDLRARTSRYSSTVEEARAVFPTSFEDITSLSAAEFKSWVARARDGQTQYLAMMSISSECSRVAAELFKRAFAELQINKPAWTNSRSDGTSKKIEDDVLVAEELVVLSQLVRGRERELESWLSALSASADEESALRLFRDLPRVCKLADQRLHARSEFVRDTKTFLSGKNPSEAAEWLRSLNSQEILSLVDNLDLKAWPVPAAVLFRLGLDQKSEAFISAASRMLISSQEVPLVRDLLHFCSPSSTSFDSHVSARRIIAVERLRDIVNFGPLALLTDPSCGLSDADVVGPTVVQLIDLLNSHLELFADGAAIRQLNIAGSEAPHRPAEDLRTFVSTPSSMAGIFRLLRECARERLFAPLLKYGRLDQEGAIELLDQLRASDLSESIIAEASGRIAGHARIEARHRMQLQRYLSDGASYLSAFAASLRKEDARVAAFRKELSTLSGHLRSGSETRGDIVWLEKAVGDILVGRSFVPSYQTLEGPTGLLSEASWRSSDTIWAQRTINLGEFYLEQECDPLVVCLACLSRWAVGQKLEIAEIVSQLTKVRAFPAALQAIQELATELERESLVGAVVAEFGQESKSISERLSRLATVYGPERVNEASLKPSIDRALASYDIDEVIEYLDLLEFELSERQASGNQAVEDGSQRRELLQLLLLAGVVGLEEGVSLHDLNRRWETELQRRDGERVHLKAVEDALSAANATLPDFVPRLIEFRQRNFRADRWLPQDRAESLTLFMRDAITKLRTWTESAGVFEQRARLSLEALAEWFIQFLEERVETLRTFGAAESIDDVLERVMEVCDCIGHSADPGACLAALKEIGELVNQAKITEGDAPEPVEAGISELHSLIKAENWAGLINCVERLTDVASQEDRSRFDDLKLFAETMTGFAMPEAVDKGLVDAARTLGAAVQPVYQALPQKRLLELAYQIIASSMALEEKAKVTNRRPERDESWATLLSKRPELYRSLGATSTGRTAKIIEQLCAGALGMEVVDRIWNAITNVSDVGALRASFLSFLHEQDLDRHVIALAGRYEPVIRGRLEQLLELRAVSAIRNDLVPVAQLLAEQLASAAKTVPFRSFMRSLPLTTLTYESDLRLTVEDRVVLRSDRNSLAQAQVSILVEPVGLVPEKIEVSLFPDDDVAFGDGSRRKVLSEAPIYAPMHCLLPIDFGEAWKTKEGQQDTIRIRVSARLVTGELLNKDATCELTRVDRSDASDRRIDNDTLLESYPGVENTPAAGDAFIGRGEELERLNEVLVSSRRPSPVLLTGMRRIGKTSLLFAFHERNRILDRTNAITIYLSLAERRSQFMDLRTDVSSVFFGAVSHALSKRHFSSADHNRIIGEKIQAFFNGDVGAAKRAIQNCHETESLSDSVVVLCERILQWIGGFAERVIFLIDEAETLVVPYRAGGSKRLELEQFLQSLREISQTSSSVGILLCGSNHIAEFSKQYKNAFFGSCVEVQLGGITEFDLARKIVAPSRLAPFVSFQDQAIQHAIDLCAGTPQFMWQVGAASAAMVRSGPIARVDVRQAVASLMDDRSSDLPFKPYDVLEPLEYMLGLHGKREQDLYWVLLWRAAFGSSLANEHVQQHFIVDAELLQIESAEAWRDRLLGLVELGILEIPRPSMYRFRVPIFAEAFRAPKHRHGYLVRLQRLAN